MRFRKVTFIITGWSCVTVLLRIFWVKNARLYQHAAEGLYSGRKSLSHRFVMCGTSTWIKCMVGGWGGFHLKVLEDVGFSLMAHLHSPSALKSCPIFQSCCLWMLSLNKLTKQTWTTSNGCLCVFGFLGEKNLFLDLMHCNGDANFWVLFMSTIKIFTFHQGLGMWFPSFNKSWDDVG